MEENQGLDTELEGAAQNQGDAFAEGWDDETVAGGTADQPDAEDDGQEPPAEDGETGGEDEKAGGDEPDRAGDKPAENAGSDGDNPPAEQTWEVNHLGARKTMRVQDITTELLQKGLDYDRVREQYDRSKPTMSMVSELARQAGVNVEEYVRMVRTEAKLGKGLSEDEARRAVELEDREAAVAAREAEEAQADAERKDSETVIQRNLEEFSKAFPEVYEKARTDTSVIPDSVWADVSGGMSLTAAYAKYAVAEADKAAKAAETKAQAAEQNRQNTQRSTGSMRSAGSDAKNKDSFLEGWGD